MRNESVFYEEFRKNMESIRDDRKQDMLAAAKALSKVSHLARCEGVLSLEHEANEEYVSDLILGDELKRIMASIVDGTDPNILESIVLKRYFSRGYCGVEGLFYLIYLDIFLEIQAGVSPMMIDESIKALFPAYIEEEMEDYLTEQNQDMRRYKEFFREEGFNRSDYSKLEWIESDNMRLIDKCITSMSNGDVQRVIRETDSMDFLICMKTMDSAAVKKLYDNLPKTERNKMYELSKQIGVDCCEDIGGAAERILKIIRRLEDEGEIHLYSL